MLLASCVVDLSSGGIMAICLGMLSDLDLLFVLRVTASVL